MDGAGFAFSVLAVFAAIVLVRAIAAGISAARDPQPRTASEIKHDRVVKLLVEQYPVRSTDLTERSGPQRLTPREAEETIAEWMRRQGFADAMVTPATNDGGIDVASARVFAQVKHYTGTIGPAAVRELAGVVGLDRSGRVGAFFTSGAYSNGAKDFAANAGVALFQYDADGANVRAVNDHARQLLT